MVACQVPLSVGFYRQEYWSGLPFPSPGDHLDPGIKPTSLMSPELAGRFFRTSSTWEAPVLIKHQCNNELSTYYIKKKKSVANWVRKSAWNSKWQPTSVFFSEKFHGQRSLVGYGPWDCKEADTLSNWACTHTHTHTHTHTANINIFLACIRDYITEKETLNIKKGKQLILEFNLQVFSYIQHEVGKIFLQKMR